MGIRQTIAFIIDSDRTPGDAARLICGYLSCECGLDNGNGWYDDDPEMSQEGGLARAEETWLKLTGRPVQ